MEHCRKCGCPTTLYVNGVPLCVNCDNDDAKLDDSSHNAPTAAEAAEGMQVADGA